MKHLTLQRTLKFTVEDLKANRDGVLSEKQSVKYKPPQFSPLVIVVLLGHAAVIGGILGAIAIATGETALWIVLVIVMAAILLPFVLFRNEGNIKPSLRSDALAGKVVKACGIVILSEKKGRQTYYELYIEGVTLELSASQASAFVHQDSYCVYYLPRSRTLLTAEPFE